MTRDQALYIGMIRGAVRKAISDSGRSQLSIARQAEIAPCNLSQFLNGRVNMTNKSLDRLFAALGLTVAIERMTGQCND